MSMELPESTNDDVEHLPFETRQLAEGKVVYIFDGVTIGIDSTYKNHPTLPEIVFGQFDKETGAGTFDKAGAGNTHVGMDYIARCIEGVVSTTGIHTFWFYPYGDDAPTGNNERRERARLKLFGKLTQNITPDPEGHGYILTV